MASVPCCPVPPDTRTSLERLQDRLFQTHLSRPTRLPLHHLCRLYHRERPPGLLARKAFLSPTHQAQTRLQARLQARSSSRSRPYLRQRRPPLPASIHQALRLCQSTRVAVRLHLVSVQVPHHRRHILEEHRRHQCTPVEVEAHLLRSLVLDHRLHLSILEVHRLQAPLRPRRLHPPTQEDSQLLLSTLADLPHQLSIQARRLHKSTQEALPHQV